MYVNTTSETMTSELERMIRINNMEKVQKIIRYKKEQGTIDHSKILDALECAVGYERYEMFEFIVEHSNYDIDYKNPHTLLMRILDNSDFSINGILYVLDRTRDINTLNNDSGETILNNLVYKCCDDREKYRPLMIECLKRGASPVIGEFENWSLNLVIRLGSCIYEDGEELCSFEVLKLMIEHCHEDISFEALRIAIYENNYDFVEYLINHVKDINQVDINGFTLLQIAVEQFSNKSENNPTLHDIIELLKESGAHF